MGITPFPTGSVYKTFTFDGESSASYGVMILGEGVFNAPEREVEMISIPGRNGAYALDKGRFENIEVTYPATIVANNPEDFAQAVSDLRNMLCSKTGYCRLSDDYHPDEYRKAVYKSGLEVEEMVLKAGEFDIVFDCKPQRWLLDGDAEMSVTSGDKIFNPTRFPSHPLLLVDGYGAIQFNGYEIEIDNAVMGEITLVDEMRISTNGIDKTLDSALYDTGDTITFHGAERYYSLTLSTGASSMTITGCSDSNNLFSTTISNDMVVHTTIPTLTFVAGTAKTVTNDVTIDITVTRPGQSSVSDQLILTQKIKHYVFNGRHDFEVDWAIKKSEFLWVQAGQMLSTINAITVDSTLSILGDPTYVDCDMGEAYMIKNGSYISLNQYIDLGSDVPKFAPGENTITFDNTITELNVLPRWWKI